MEQRRVRCRQVSSKAGRTAPLGIDRAYLGSLPGANQAVLPCHRHDTGSLWTKRAWVCLLLDPHDEHHCRDAVACKAGLVRTSAPIVLLGPAVGPGCHGEPSVSCAVTTRKTPIPTAGARAPADGGL
jgi:hypothetical protein